MQFFNLSAISKKKLILRMQIPSQNVLDLRTYSTWMGDDGIARTVVKEGAEIVLEDAKANSIAVCSLAGPEKFALIVDTRKIKSITKEARDYFSLNGRESRVVAFAILIDSPLSVIIGNFFMGLNKPRVPVKLFNSESKAIAWCHRSTSILVPDEK
jgi:hypothetical protein